MSALEGGGDSAQPPHLPTFSALVTPHPPLSFSLANLVTLELRENLLKSLPA